jgi:hypothetical protein
MEVLTPSGDVAPLDNQADMERILGSFNQERQSFVHLFCRLGQRKEVEVAPAEVGG